MHLALNPHYRFDTLLILLVLLTANLPTIHAQNDPRISKLDSVYRVCLDDPDSTCLNLINSGCNTLYSKNRDTVAFYSREQIRLAKQIANRRFEARGYNMLGVCTELNGQLDSAITLYLKALDISKEIADNQLQVDVANNLGIAYSSKGLFESSIEYTLVGLDIAQQIGDSTRQSMLLNNLGLRYKELMNQEVAIDYFKKALELNKAIGNDQKLSINYNNLGLAYGDLAKYDTSMQYWEKGLISAKENDRPYDIIIAFNGLAITHLRKGNYNLAQAYNDSARIRSEQINDTYGIIEAKMVQGYIFQRQKRFQQAIPLLEEALEYFDELKYMQVAQDIRANLAECHNNISQNATAYRYMRQFAFLKDSIYSKQRDLAFEQITLFKELKQEQEKELLNKELELRDQSVRLQKSIRNASVAIGGLMLVLAIAFGRSFYIERKVKNTLAEKNTLIAEEKERSDNLLLNILPASVAEELKLKGTSEARDFDKVTVLFTDFEEFTRTTKEFTAKGLVEELNTCFKAFDGIMGKHNIEKIKTIGDAYMAAGGLHTPRTTEPRDVLYAALEMQEFMNRRKTERDAAGLPAFSMRVGIHTGNVVAGIVGVKKFQYDIWGDTVNTASRMESNCEAGKINISNVTYLAVRDLPDLHFEPRGSVEVKGIGVIDMWFVSKNDPV